MLLPSSGKVNELKYEFIFVSGEPNKKPITCQVKNQNSAPIDIADYENDKDIYERIYLFSGNDNFIGRERAKDNIEIINHSELFDVSKRGTLKFMYDKLSRYHSFGDGTSLNEIQSVLSDKGWLCKRRYQSGASDFKRYKVKYENGEIKLTLGYDGFYITDNFDCFIIKWEDENTEKIKNELKKDLGTV